MDKVTVLLIWLYILVAGTVLGLLAYETF